MFIASMMMHKSSSGGTGPTRTKRGEEPCVKEPAVSQLLNNVTRDQYCRELSKCLISIGITLIFIYVALFAFQDC